MASTYLQPAPPLLRLPARNGCTGRKSGMAVVSCKCNQSSDVQKAKFARSISRRDALSYMSAALLPTFLVTNPSEAGASARQENKIKAREKLEKLRATALASEKKKIAETALKASLKKKEGTGKEKVSIK